MEINRSDIPYSIRHLEDEFDRAFEASQKNRDMADRAWSAYSGFDHGQWPDSAVAALSAQNRHIVQYNFIRGKIDGLAGNIAKSEMDIDFVPVDSEETELTRILKQIYYSDKELLDWDREFIQCVTDGLVHQGVEQIVVSTKYSPLGNIGFERIQPGHIILDPEWKTHNSADLKRAWKVTYMTAEDMKVLYKAKADKIDQEIALRRLRESDYENDQSSTSMQYLQLDESYGDLYRVIEHHYLKNVPVEIEVAVSGDFKMTIPDDLSDEDKNTFLKQNGLKKADIIKHRIVRREYHVTTTCRQLSPDLLLEDSKADIQIGRLPFFPWSAARINGIDSGVVELLIDAQQTLNKRESLADHIISSSAHGAMLFDPAMFNNDPAMMQELIKNIDKPNAKIVTAPGALASGRRYTQLIEKSQYQGEIYQDIQRMTDAMDKISRQTATMDGQNENAHETGILFARKQMQGEIAMSTLMKSIDQHWNDKAEAFMELAKELYSGVYREFTMDFKDSTNQETVKLNVPQYTEDGDRVITNDLKNLSRHKVIVSKSPNGITQRLTDRAINVELMGALPQSAYLSVAQLTKNIMKTLDMSDEDKRKMEYASELEYKNAEARMNAEIAQMEAQVQQTKAQVEQAQQQTQMGDMQMAQARMQGAQGGEGQPQPQQQQPKQ